MIWKKSGRSSMKKIDELFRHNPKFKGYQKPLEAAKICDIARAQSDGRFDAISFRGGLLTIAVNSPAEASNLQMESPKIIDEINQKLGENLVKDIRFKIQ